MSKMIIVSNRLPVTIRHTEAGGVQVVPSTGGLATGLAPIHACGETLWVGWPGDLEATIGQQTLRATRERLAADRLVPVDIPEEDLGPFYHDFSNGVLWPLFHYLIDRLPLEMQGYDAYKRVNERFADAVVSHYQDGDSIWVHDYQLALVPGLLRQRLPEARIGFFLHIPFPSSDVFRVLPWREEILKGMSGADLVGFHAFSYARHYASCLLRILGIEADVDRYQYQGRDVHIGAYPLGIDPAPFAQPDDESAVTQEVQRIKEQLGLRPLILSVDRLDYTKGIPRRVLAFERLLEREADLRGEAVLLQVAVPSRADVPAYSEYGRAVNEVVGRVNGRFGAPGYQPVQYLSQAYTQRELVALFRAASVMVVTPLRDGMNLVAKEFLAARPDEDGVLVLSELAGAAAELGEALIVNPYDLDAVAATIARGLRMSRTERQVRMRALRSRVVSFNSQRWAGAFIHALAEAGLAREASVQHARTGKISPTELASRVSAVDKLTLMLDYDGTLVPLTNIPDLASPDVELLQLLTTLATRGVAIHIVSGRPRDVLGDWLGTLDLALHTEHGLWSRSSRHAEWQAAAPLDDAWKERVLPILEQFTSEIPGAFIEQKTLGLAWHYRMADPVIGPRKANELRFQLLEALSNLPLEVLAGKKVVEVRRQGVHKGLVAERIASSLPPGRLLIAMGDDQTDEDLFAALPAAAVSVRVGLGRTVAGARLADVDEVREFLRELTRLS